MKLEHIIGRTITFIRQTFFPTQKTVDETRTNYEWWDKFRRGKQVGYAISGPQSNSLIDVISSWVLGRGVSMALAEISDKRMTGKVDYTNDMLRRLFYALQGFLTQVFKDKNSLGDAYVHVAIDGSMTQLRPDTVQIFPDLQDATKVDHYTVVNVYDTYVLEEEFYADKRVRRLKKFNDARPGKSFTPPRMVIDRTGKSSSLYVNPPALTDIASEVFPNPIGRVPIVHFANLKQVGELYGHPTFESMLDPFANMDDMASKSFKGAKIMGTPVPVVSNLSNPSDYATENKKAEDETYTDEDGNSDIREVLKYEENAMLVLGEGAEFKFAAPPVGFSHDILSIIDSVRRLARDLVHVPPHMWGGVDTKQEDAAAQTDPWVRIVEQLRDDFAGTPEDADIGIMCEGGLHELAYLWLKAKSLTDRKIMVAPTVIRWADLAKEDKAISFEMIKWLHSRGLLTNETALHLTDLVENINSEVEKAQKQMDERMQQQMDDFGGVGNDAKNPVTQKGANDKRAGNGADAPRMPATSGGGRGTGSANA